jgi:hypothetical protein
MKTILDELEALERIVGGGGELPTDRDLRSSYTASDQFPLRDENANAIFTLEAEYRTLR